MYPLSTETNENSPSTTNSRVVRVFRHVPWRYLYLLGLSLVILGLLTCFCALDYERTHHNAGLVTALCNLFLFTIGFVLIWAGAALCVLWYMVSDLQFGYEKGTQQHRASGFDVVGGANGQSLRSLRTYDTEPYDSSRPHHELTYKYPTITGSAFVVTSALNYFLLHSTGCLGADNAVSISRSSCYLTTATIAITSVMSVFHTYKDLRATRAFLQTLLSRPMSNSSPRKT
jgi:hypothetical protein